MIQVDGHWFKRLVLYTSKFWNPNGPFPSPSDSLAPTAMAVTWLSVTAYQRVTLTKTLDVPFLPYEIRTSRGQWPNGIPHGVPDHEKDKLDTTTGDVVVLTKCCPASLL